MSSANRSSADEPVLETDNFAAELFWEKHRGSILVGVAAVVLAVGGSATWFISAHNTTLAAQAFFAGAKNPEAWREVIAKYPASPQAAGAYFLLAESQREQGSLAESTGSLEKFLSNFPGHPLAGGARLGLAENYELAGKPNEALTALREVQSKDAGSYAAPFAALLEGRLALREGKLEEARKVFLNLVSTYSQSPVARVAGAQLEEITSLIPPAVGPPAVPAQTLQ